MRWSPPAPAASTSSIPPSTTATSVRNAAIGAALRQLQRDEIVVCTKAGFLTPGAVPAFLKPEHVVGKMHSMDPDFLADQIDRSRANLGVDTIDVFYLHNPETQLGFLTREEFDERLRRAFARLEQLAADAEDPLVRRRHMGRLPQRAHSACRAWWNSPSKTADRNTISASSSSRSIVGMVEAYRRISPESVLQAASRLGIAAIASATLSRRQVLEHIPEALAGPAART